VHAQRTSFTLHLRQYAADAAHAAAAAAAALRSIKGVALVRPPASERARDGSGYSVTLEVESGIGVHGVTKALREDMGYGPHDIDLGPNTTPPPKPAADALAQRLRDASAEVKADALRALGALLGERRVCVQGMGVEVPAYGTEAIGLALDDVYVDSDGTVMVCGGQVLGDDCEDEDLLVRPASELSTEDLLAVLAAAEKADANARRRRRPSF
jgi:hypothetical protein